MSRGSKTPCRAAISYPYVEGCNKTLLRVQKAGFTMTSGSSGTDTLYPLPRHKASREVCLQPTPRPVAGVQNRGEIEPGVGITPYKGVGAYLRTPPWRCHYRG